MNWKGYWPSFLWALIIVILCSIPGKDIPSRDWMQLVALDKWVHFGMFAVLIILVLHPSRVFVQDGQWKSQYKWYWISAAILFGALTEIYQHLALHDRFADPYDFIANTIGVIIGAWLYERYASAVYRRWFNEKTF